MNTSTNSSTDIDRSRSGGMAMNVNQKVLFVDPSTGYYRIRRYPAPPYFGPLSLGIHLAGRERSLNFGTGLFAGSILPGSNRLMFSGFSPSWRGFYVSSMGGAGLVFDNLGINMVSLVGKAAVPSILYLNRNHGEEIEVEVSPVDLNEAWALGRGGVYGLMERVLARHAGRYGNDPRVLVTGPAALATDFGAIMSAPVKDGAASPVDTWAGRGGLGSKMLQEHGIAAVIYGGTVVDEDFRDRTVADGWFESRYRQRLAVKDFEGTTKYRFDPKVDTGGTFGVNYATVKGRIIAFNYRTATWTEAERLDLHKRLIVEHYLAQFNEETIVPRRQATCGEPCAAVCKKMKDEFKKDYEPYQSLGPLCGIFDQRAAELLNAAADSGGFDGIALGGILAWLMDCLDTGLLSPADLGVTELPVWKTDSFDPVADSLRNARLGLELVASILKPEGGIDLSEGPRKWARKIRREKGVRILDRFVYCANGRRGWMVPNQYWTPGVLAPMAIMGKYYMHYGAEFMPPRELGRACAARLVAELALDEAGICRFHRAWAEEMVPEIFGSLYGMKDEFQASIRSLASRINSRNASVYWESARNIEFVSTFLTRRLEVDADSHPELVRWVEAFASDPKEAALSWWFEVRKGIDESLRDFL